MQLFGMTKASPSINTLADRIDQLSESQTLAMAAKVRQLKAEGKEVISLTLGEPDFDTPHHIREAAKQALDDGYTHYPPVAGLPELRQAVAQHLNHHFGLACQSREIIVSTGAKQSLHNLMMVLVNPGDEVVIIAPYWVSYLPMIQLAEGQAVVAQTTVEDAYKITPEKLDSVLTDRTRAVIFNSPGNPSGSIYSEAEIRALADVLDRYPHVWVISDEIYAHVRYISSYTSFSAVDRLQHRTITVSGVSKAFAMTGWRIGFTAGPASIIEGCEKYQGQTTSGANAMAQRAVIAAMEGDMQPTHNMVRAFQERRDFLLSFFQREIPDFRMNIPDGAFYLYVDCSAYWKKSTPQGVRLQTPADLGHYLLEQAGVAVVSGEGFGTQDHLRLSYATELPILEKAAAQMAEALHQLK